MEIMSRKWYGSLDNRLEENKQFCETIEVGTGVTEYSWSDRHPYEVVEVKDQKHVVIRGMRHEHDPKAEPMTNSWIITSDESASTEELVKRGNYWYSVVAITPAEAKEILEGDDVDSKIWACLNGFDLQEIVDAGKTKKKYNKRNISFGKADYHYDYEF